MRLSFGLKKTQKIIKIITEKIRILKPLHQPYLCKLTSNQGILNFTNSRRKKSRKPVKRQAI